MNVFVRYLICLILGSLVVVGCVKPPEERAKNKVARILKKYPNILKSDSTSRKDSLAEIIEGIKEFDNKDPDAGLVSSIDSLLGEYQFIIPLESDSLPNEEISDNITNSNPVKPIANLRNSLLKIVTIESLMKPIQFDTAGAKVNVSAKGNKVKIGVKFPKVTISITKEKHTVIPCPEDSYFGNLWKVKEVIGLLIGIIIFLGLLILFMK